MKQISTHWWLVVPTVCFAVLVTFGALAHPLWSDEAQTAVFARNILRYGVPRGWDGVNLVGAYSFGVVLRTDCINHVNSWLQFYLATASFRLFGVSSFAARLPFMLFAIPTIPLVGLFAFRLTGKKTVAAMAAIGLAVSVQYILYSYQARYYAVSAFFSLAFLLGALRLIREQKRGALLTGIAATFLLYNNYIVSPIFFASAFAGSIAYLRFLGASREKIRKFVFLVVAACVAAALVFAPWFFLMRPLDRQRGVILPRNNLASVSSLEFYRFFGPILESGVLPIGFFPFLAIFLWRFSGNKKDRAPLRFLFPMFLCYSVLTILLASITSVGNTGVNLVDSRYHVALIPLFAIAMAIVTERYWAWNKVFGSFLFVLAFSGILVFSQPRFFLREYLHEIRHPYETPDAAVAAFLSEHANDGDTVFINRDRDHEPLIFLLDQKMRFVNRVNPLNSFLLSHHPEPLPKYLSLFTGHPDWVVLYSTRGDDGTYFTSGYRGAFPRGLDKSVSIERDYTEAAVLPVFFTDMSRPELPFHQFRKVEPEENDQIFVYRLKQKKEQ